MRARLKVTPHHLCQDASIPGLPLRPLGCNLWDGGEQEGGLGPWVCSPSEKNDLCQLQGCHWREADGDQEWITRKPLQGGQGPPHPGRKAGGGVGGSTITPWRASLPRASGSPRPAHGGCRLPPFCWIGGAGEIPAVGEQSLHPSC